MLGYYEIEDEIIKKLPPGSKNIKENIYELCCPLVVMNKKNLPSDLSLLYEVLEIPIIQYQDLKNFDSKKYESMYTYLEKFSEYLKLNVAIEELEEGRVGHLLRVGKSAKVLCDALGLSKEETQSIYIAALFHDVGKYRVPSHIVGKRGRLSTNEFNMIKNHCNYAYDMLKDFLSKDTLDIIKSHHERCDRSGYPEGSIPNLGAKIIGIVDSYDAMTANRVYHHGKNKKDAYQELLLCGKPIEQGGKGRMYDIELVEKFIQMNER